jgi:hypothetical protein
LINASNKIIPIPELLFELPKLLDNCHIVLKSLLVTCNLCHILQVLFAYLSCQVVFSS